MIKHNTNPMRERCSALYLQALASRRLAGGKWQFNYRRIKVHCYFDERHTAQFPLDQAYTFHFVQFTQSA